MFEDEEWEQLLDKLRQLTEAQRIAWSVDKEGDAVETTIGETAYSIRSKDFDGVAPWVFAVARVGVTNQTLDELVSSGGEPRAGQPTTKVGALRTIAYRQALGGPDLARNLLNELNDLDPRDPAKWGEDSSPF